MADGSWGRGLRILWGSQQKGLGAWDVCAAPPLHWVEGGTGEHDARRPWLEADGTLPHPAGAGEAPEWVRAEGPGSRQKQPHHPQAQHLPHRHPRVVLRLIKFFFFLSFLQAFCFLFWIAGVCMKILFQPFLFEPFYFFISEIISIKSLWKAASKERCKRK